MKKYGQVIFAALNSAGVGCMIGSVYEGDMRIWAVGTTLITASGILYLLTRKQWDNGL